MLDPTPPIGTVPDKVYRKPLGAYRMYTIRRYQVDDIPKLVEYIGEHLKTSGTYSDFKYDPNRMKGLLDRNIPNQLFFCNLAVAEDGEILAGLCAQAKLPVFSSTDVIICDELIYVRPQYRSKRCVDDLIKSYVDWTESRQAKQVLLGTVTGINQDAYGRLVGRHGFEEIGRVYALSHKEI